MKPISFTSHTKPISDIQFSKEGDLLFISSKDHKVTVWYTKNYELLGSYECDGAINQIAINDKCTRLLAACGNYELLMFDVKTGKELLKYKGFDDPVVACGYSEGDKYFFASSKSEASIPNTAIHIFESPTEGTEAEARFKPKKIIFDADSLPDVKISSAVWGPLNETIIVGHTDGTLTMFDVESEKVLKRVTHHKGMIKRLQKSPTGDFVITASDDKTARLYDIRTLECIKVYELSENVTTAAISPLKYHVVLGGGRADIATVTGSDSSFNCLHFFHLIFQHELGTIKAHFSPVNIIRFSPDGKMVVSGGEDGVVKLFPLDKNLLSMRDDLKSINISNISKNE